jgi:serine/threonine-protein kinase HSL1, negative regulator of Swe1 kinase
LHFLHLYVLLQSLTPLVSTITLTVLSNKSNTNGDIINIAYVSEKQKIFFQKSPTKVSVCSNKTFVMPSLNHKASQRQILADITASNQNEFTPNDLLSQSLPPLAQTHHESIKENVIPERNFEPENKHLTAVGNGANKRDSQGSASTATSCRERKRHIGPWLLGPTLGHGATGRVRKARHTLSGQIAAIKIMSKRDAKEMRSQSVMQMDCKLRAKPLYSDQKALPFGIEREVVIMKLIEHPNIIKLYDLWENRGEL